jgi:hypothetical protein
MQNAPEQASYQFTGPDENGIIRLQMPNLDPSRSGEFFCVTLGSNKDSIAKAMRQWLGSVDCGDCE